MFDRALNVRDSTEMNNDPFSDILKLASPESLVTGGFTAGGRWALRFPAPDNIKFFAVVKGHCQVMLDGEATPTLFTTGDVGLLSAKRSFVLGSESGLEAIDAMSVFSGPITPHAPIGEGDDFRLIGGHVLLDPVGGKLLRQVLPPWIHVSAEAPEAASFRGLLDHLVQERLDPRPGSNLASAHLAQLLFIQILRAHLHTGEAPPAGWLGVLRNPRLAPALRLMHSDPAHPWHLEELASACAMSRTTFAQQFRGVSGMTPIAYLTHWRMRLAERALREDDKHIAKVAQSLGYASESAFSNAFKRETGRSPKAWRLAAKG